MPNIIEDAATTGFAELMIVARLRAEAYRLLATGLLDPTTELAVIVADCTYAADLRDSLLGLRLPDGRFESTLASIEESLSTYSGRETEKLYHELAVEYARLFIGPERAAVSPYESVFMSSSSGTPGLLMVGPAAKAVLSTYREAGVRMARGVNEPPDHIATELEFMFYLCAEEAACWGRADNVGAKRLRGLEHAFAVEHLGRWGVDFCQAVQRTTKQPFYAAVATYGMTLFQFESDIRRA